MSTSNSFLQQMRKLAGATLIEAVMYLGIAAIVMLAVLSLISLAFQSAKENQIALEIVQIRKNIRKMYSMSLPTMRSNGNLNRPLINAGIFPTTLAVNTAAHTVTNAFGGTVTVTGPSGSNFDITYTEIPNDFCINLISNSNSTGWAGIKVNGVNPYLTPSEFNPVTASIVCNADSNSIDWIASF